MDISSFISFQTTRVDVQTVKTTICIINSEAQTCATEESSEETSCKHSHGNLASSYYQGHHVTISNLILVLNYHHMLVMPEKEKTSTHNTPPQI